MPVREPILTIPARQKQNQASVVGPGRELENSTPGNGHVY
jgi:hypothetical protein